MVLSHLNGHRDRKSSDKQRHSTVFRRDSQQCLLPQPLQHRADHDTVSVLFDDEDLVVNEVVRLVGVQPCAAEIIYLNLALGKLYGLISVLVRVKFLRVEFSGCFPSVLLILLGFILGTSTHKSIT